MRKEAILCDNCGKHTFDIYNENGWLLISASSTTNPDTRTLNLYKGRDKRNVSQSRKATLLPGRATHFCCRSCLEDYLNEKMREVYESI
jgi:hypothetical protein